MTDTNGYKCVHCGEPSAALYKSYGPTVLKLTKCAYWKLLIILIMLETYGVWRGDSLFNIAVNS
ncbi:Protein ARV1, partial [Operophtera brumata]